MAPWAVQVTADPRLLAQAAALRTEVFVLGQGVPPEIERDGQDSAAWHAVVLDDSADVLATGRVLDAGDHARIGRVATRAAARGSGAGTAVIAALEAVAALRGLPALRLHAQVPVVGFYERLGYRTVGPPGSEAGLEHRWMVRDLLPGLRPVVDDDSQAIRELIGGCFAEYPGCVLDPDGIDAWMARPATLRGAAGALWVLPAAKAQAGLAACVGWAPAGPGVELKSLYVAAPARRAGLGRALVGLVERAARARGAARVELWSDTRFADAHRLYHRLGYRRLAATRDLHDLSHTTEYAFVRDLELATGGGDLPARPGARAAPDMPGNRHAGGG